MIYEIFVLVFIGSEIYKGTESFGTALFFFCDESYGPFAGGFVERYGSQIGISELVIYVIRRYGDPMARLGEIKDQVPL